MTDRTMTIRPASADDAVAVRRLAALDSSAPLTGRVLLAELDGDPVAAVSVDTGSVIADPFQPAAHAVRVLLLRRNQLISDATGVARARPLVRRVAVDPAR